MFTFNHFCSENISKGSSRILNEHDFHDRLLASEKNKNKNNTHVDSGTATAALKNSLTRNVYFNGLSHFWTCFIIEQTVMEYEYIFMV